MSKRKRREEEELEAQRARDAARAHLDKKGYVFDHAKTGIDIANAKKRKDNTLELVEKRKKQQEQQRIKNVNMNFKPRNVPLQTNNNVQQLVSKPIIKKIVKKIGQNTMFGIPQQNTDVLPENWVLVQSHSDETKYYFWNVKDNTTSWKKPVVEVVTTPTVETATVVDSNNNNEISDEQDEEDDEDDDIYSSFDVETKRTYYYSTNSWKTKFNKAKLLKTNDEDREEDDRDNIDNSKNELEQETFDMDGNTYNINDFEKARQDAIANRQKKQ